MANSERTGGVDRLLDRLEVRARFVRQMRELVADDPQFGRQLIVALRATIREQENSGNSAPARKRSRNFERLQAVLMNAGNPWMTVDQIVAVSGMMKNAVLGVLYKSAAERFEKRPKPGDARFAEFRIKTEPTEAGASVG